MISLIILFCFFVRALPRLKYLNGLGNDTLSHYALTKKINKNKSLKLWDNVVLLKSLIGYPYLNPLIVSIL